MTANVPALSLTFRQPDYEAKALPNNIEAAIHGRRQFAGTRRD